MNPEEKDQEQDSELPGYLTRQEADESLRCIAYWQEKREKDKKHAMAEIRRASDWLERLMVYYEQKIQYHRARLRIYLRTNNLKKDDLINGRISLGPGRKSVRVIDEETLLDYLNRFCPTAIITTQDPRLLDVRELIENGVEVPGAEIVQDPEELKIRQERFPKHTDGDEE